MNDSQAGRAMTPRPLKVLVLSRNYPNSVLPLLGLWVQSLVRHSARFCLPKVIAPVPYSPPLPRLPERYARFRRIERRRQTDGIDVYHPRFLVPPGYWFHSFESVTYLLSVVGLIDRLRRDFPFDLIHAHFVVPDGYVAARLGRRYGVPVIITEQAPWRPWLDKYAVARRQAIWAAQHCAFLVAISTAVRDTIVHFTGESSKIQVIPDGVDGSVFTLAHDGPPPSPTQILFVGIIRPVKGVDVLLRAMRLLADKGRDAKLVLVGESYYENYRREYVRVRQMASELKLTSQVEFAGQKPLAELVRYMQQSALLVLPSRQESLGMVLVEALACGTPVVATRCGGPEDIVTDAVGVLVPPDDPAALARGIEHVLNRRSAYHPPALRAHALSRFGLDGVTHRISDLYDRAVRDHRQRGNVRAPQGKGCEARL